MRDTAAHRLLGVEEYLRLEESSDVRHELVAGEIYAMSGGTLRHNQIAGNIFAALHGLVRGGPCHVFVNDVKLRIGDDFYYPDLIVDCEPHGSGEVFVRAPCLLVEVLSDSTRRTDRREKLEAYRRVESLRAYLLVEQDERRVDRHWRDDDGAWRHEEVSSTAGTATVLVPCPRTALSLDAIYEGAELPEPHGRVRRVREGGVPATR